MSTARFGTLELDRSLVASFESKYGDRPDVLERTLENAVAYERLRAMALEPSPYTKGSR